MEFEVGHLLFYQRSGSSFQFITIYRTTNQHEAEWKPIRNFVDADHSIAEALLSYIKERKISHHLDWYVSTFINLHLINIYLTLF